MGCAGRGGVALVALVALVARVAGQSVAGQLELWGSSNAAVTNGAFGGPFGSDTAVQVQEVVVPTDDVHSLNSVLIGVSPNNLYELSVYAKVVSGETTLSLSFVGPDFGPEFAVFDLDAGTAYVVPSPTDNHWVSIDDVGNGWFHLRFVDLLSGVNPADAQIALISGYDATVYPGDSARTMLLSDVALNAVTVPAPAFVRHPGHYTEVPEPRLVCLFPGCAIAYRTTGTPAVQSDPQLMPGSFIAVANPGTTPVSAIAFRTTNDAPESVAVTATYMVGDPDGIALSLTPNSVPVDSEAHSVVGTLSFAQAVGVPTFSLVSGSGSNGNPVFYINGSSLLLADGVNLETLLIAAVPIRVRASDGPNFAEASLTVGLSGMDVDPYDSVVLPVGVSGDAAAMAPRSVATLYTGDSTIAADGSGGRFGLKHQLTFNYSTLVLSYPSGLSLSPAQIAGGGIFAAAGLNTIELGSTVTHALAGSYSISIKAFERDSNALHASRVCDMDIACMAHTAVNGVAARVTILFRGLHTSQFTSDVRDSLRAAVARGVGASVDVITLANVGSGLDSQGTSTEVTLEASEVSVRQALSRPDDTLVSLVALDVPPTFSFASGAGGLWKEVSAHVARSNGLGCSAALVSCDSPPMVAPEALWEFPVEREDEALVALSSTYGEVRYTTDGSPATSASQAYAQPFVLNSTGTVRAVAVLTHDGAEYMSPERTVDVTLTPSCGNGVLGALETCDDGNHNNGDGCSADCRLETASGQRAAGLFQDGKQVTKSFAAAEAVCVGLASQLCTEASLKWAVHAGITALIGPFWIAGASNNVVHIDPTNTVFGSFDVNADLAGVLCCG